MMILKILLTTWWSWLFWSWWLWFFWCLWWFWRLGSFWQLWFVWLVFFVILWLVKVLWLPWLIDIVITGVVTCTTIGRLLSKDDAKNRLQYSIIRPCFQDYHDIFSEGLKPPTRYIICWRMRWLIFLTLRQKAEKPTPGAPIGGLGDAARLADQMHDSILHRFLHGKFVDAFVSRAPRFNLYLNVSCFTPFGSGVYCRLLEGGRFEEWELELYDIVDWNSKSRVKVPCCRLLVEDQLWLCSNRFLGSIFYI